MSVAFFRGQQLGEDDLHIFVTNQSGVPTDPLEITYALYDFGTGQEILLGVPRRAPATAASGHYYASMIIPIDANLGAYRIRWTMREFAGAPVTEVVQEFAVVERASQVISAYTELETELIGQLRNMLRDNNPDRHYHFQPPAHEEAIRQYNRVFGYIWQDEELRQFLYQSMYDCIAAPPRTPFTTLEMMLSSFPEWRSVLLTGAAKYALFALRVLWVSEQFSLAGDTLVEVKVDGESVQLTMKALWEACYADDA